MTNAALFRSLHDPADPLQAIVSARVPLIDPPGFLRWRARRQGAAAARASDRASENDVALTVAREYFAQKLAYVTR